MMPRDPLAWAKVADVTEAEGFALKALYSGDATPDQQRLAIAAIDAKLCRTDEQDFVLEPDGGERATNFCCGRRSVGLALRAIRDLPSDKLRKPDARRKPTERD